MQCTKNPRRRPFDTSCMLVATQKTGVVLLGYFIADQASGCAGGNSLNLAVFVATREATAQMASLAKLPPTLNGAYLGESHE